MKFVVARVQPGWVLRTYHKVKQVSMLSTQFLVLLDTRLRSMYKPDQTFGGISVLEVSMLSTQFLVLLDTRLRSMYKPDQTFGGISILPIGDFIQLPVTTGCDLWSVMYGTVSGNDRTARELFQHFFVKELTINI